MKNLTLLVSIIAMVSTMLSFNLNAEVYSWKDKEGKVIYTWTDQEGKVHYSDQPIAADKVTSIAPNKEINISKPTVPNSEWQQDYNKIKQDKTQNKIEKSQEQSKKIAYCDNLRSRLAIYQQGGRIYVMSPDGERDYTSDKELAEKKKKLTKQIKQKC